MDSDKSSASPDASARTNPGVIVGKPVTVRRRQRIPEYYTEIHRRWIGKTGRVHAIVPAAPRDNPLVKVGFDDGTQIVFFRLADLEVHVGSPQEAPRKHGARGSHLPKRR